MNTRMMSALAILTAAGGCVSLPVTRSVWSSEPQSIPETTWTRDSESDLEYLVANDNVALYIGVRIKDRMKQALVRRAGLKVYLDPTGSKREDIFVQYPYAPEPTQRPPDQRGELAVEELPVSTDLLWQHDETQLIVNPYLEKTPFKARIGVGSGGMMTFLLGVPLDSLGIAERPGAIAVSVGIEFFNPDRPRPTPETERGVERTGAPPGARGRPGGGRMGQRPPGGDGPPGRMPAANTRPVWFLAELADTPRQN